jgi:hypothetical protein
MASLVLATTLVKPSTLMFSRSLDVKNEGPKVLYLSGLPPHSPQSCRSVSPSYSIWAVEVVGPLSHFKLPSTHFLKLLCSA